MTVASTRGLIDTHHHIVPREYVESLEEKGVKKALGVRFPKWNAEKSIDVMDRYGISAAVVSISAPGVYFKQIPDPLPFASDLARRMNDFAANLVADHPTRFGAFATLPLPDIDLSIDELKRALENLKLDGVVLMSNYDGYYLGDPRFERVFSELNRRKAVVFVHPATPPGIESSHLGLPEAMMDVCFDTTRTAFSLIVNGVTRRYPEVRFILAHAGGVTPYIAGRVDFLASLFQGLGGAAAGIATGVGMVSSVIPGMKERLPEDLSVYLRFKENMPDGPEGYLRRFYYDTAVSTSPHVFASLGTVCDNSRVLFGSDYPFGTEAAIPEAINGIEAYAGFAPEDRAAIGSKNAATLFPRLHTNLEQHF